MDNLHVLLHVERGVTVTVHKDVFPVCSCSRTRSLHLVYTGGHRVGTDCFPVRTAVLRHYKLPDIQDEKEIGYNFGD